MTPASSAGAGGADSRWMMVLVHATTEPLMRSAARSAGRAGRAEPSEEEEEKERVTMGGERVSKSRTVAQLPLFPPFPIV
jgi:hypothetical protein